VLDNQILLTDAFAKSVHKNQGERVVVGQRLMQSASDKEFDRLADTENTTWTIPASRSENGRAHVVPLSRLARSIVADLIRRAEVSARKNSTDRFLLPSPGDPPARLTVTLSPWR
jgi:hypothetical protein